MTTLDELRNRYSENAPGSRSRLTEIADGYLTRASEAGYVRLAGIATAGGLVAALGALASGDGTIDVSALDPRVAEAFALQFPNLHADGALDQLTLADVERYSNGWSGKLAEIFVRDSLNDGGSIGGLSLAAGETAVLATDPTQAAWDMRIEPTGRLLQIKATENVAYVRETAAQLDGTGIDIISTDLPAFDMDYDAELYELSFTKAELDTFLSGDVEEALDDTDVWSSLGWIGLLVTAGSTALLLKKVRADISAGKDLRFLYRTYGPRVVTRAVNAASPIPFTGNAVGWYLRRRLMLSEAVRVARERVARLDRLIASRSDRQSQSSNFTS